MAAGDLPRRRHGALSKAVIRLYRARMQIEEAFRDLKNHRYGFAFRDCLTRTRYRLEHLLLIGALATLAAWRVGKVAEMMHLHRRYQANTVRTRPVLSTVSLGCEIIAAADVRMTAQDFRQALGTLSEDRYTFELVA